MQMARPSHGLHVHLKMAVPSPVGDIKIVSSISTFMLNTLTLKVLFLGYTHLILIVVYILIQITFLPFSTGVVRNLNL